MTEKDQLKYFISHKGGCDDIRCGRDACMFHKHCASSKIIYERALILWNKKYGYIGMLKEIL